MKLHQRLWTEKNGWTNRSGTELHEAQLVFAFGATGRLRNNQTLLDTLKESFPKSTILFCSTAGEISGTEVFDDSVIVTAIYFEKTTLQFTHTHIENSSQSKDAGKKLVSDLPKEQLLHTLVFSEGLTVNGSALVEGINENLPPGVSVTGGLVGDGADFKETLVGFNALPTSGNIVMIGLYGSHLTVGYGSFGGWDPFGPDRLITKSKEHILYEMDGKPALALYKEYLGEKAKELPGSGLRFPLSLKLQTKKGEVEVVRTLLGVNEQDQSLTFAGDMPEGTYCRLMKANFERLIDGAEEAASRSIVPLGSDHPELALLISCIGRKLVLGPRVEEELEAVQEKLGPKTVLTGFYSYGEICPTAPTEKQCQLHNQTMTITTLREL